MVCRMVGGGVFSAVVKELFWERRCFSNCWVRVRIVWRGSSGSQDSIHCVVGWKEPSA